MRNWALYAYRWDFAVFLSVSLLENGVSFLQDKFRSMPFEDGDTHVLVLGSWAAKFDPHTDTQIRVCTYAALSGLICHNILSHVDYMILWRTICYVIAKWQRERRI